MKKEIVIAISVAFPLLLILIALNIGVIINLSTVQKIKKNEFLYNTLKERKLSESVSNDLPTSIIRYEGLQFEHVFGNKYSKKGLAKGYLIDFDGQKKITIYEQRLGVDLMYLEPLNDKVKKVISNYYGEDILKNEFNLIKKALEVTPDDISWFSFSQKKVFANIQLLLTKLQIPLNSDQGDIFAFETRSIQGFQRGTPEQTNNILLIIFDPDIKAKYYYTIMLVGSFTQSDIDVMLNTMKFVTD